MKQTKVLCALFVGFASLLAASSASGDVFYVSNFDNDTIEKFNSSGVDLGTFASTGLDGPTGLAFDAAGSLYVSNFNSNSILKFTPNGLSSVFANTGLNHPAGLAFDQQGNLYVASQGNDAIVKFMPDGIGSVFVGFSHPHSLAFDRFGNLYVANGGIGVARFAPNGFPTLGFGINQALGLAFDGDDDLYVSVLDGTIQKVLAGGFSWSLFANASPTVSALAFDTAGNLYGIAVFGSNIQRFASDGSGSVFTTTGLSGPSFIAVQVPEPSTAVLVAAAVPALLALWRWRLR